jgi:carboxyl-terminal processing protease
MRKTTYAFWLLLLPTTLAGSYAFSSPAESKPAPASAKPLYRQLDRFEEVLQQVRANYVDKPDDAKLVEGAIQGMLSELDPHSLYMNAQEFQDLQSEESGWFAGIGLELTMNDGGGVKIDAPIEGSPAAKAGILPGDLITAIDGRVTKDMTLDQAVQSMRGPINEPVTLSISRSGSDNFDVRLVREMVQIDPVSYELDSDVGYIRIASFNDQTDADLQQAIRAINKAGGSKLKGYVLDLRNDPGGLLEQALLVANSFLDNGGIVSIRGRVAGDTHVFEAVHGEDQTHGKKLVVLINGQSASASEIVAGALQDDHRAIVVGTRSFGKGSVQTMIPLRDKGALMLTTGRYYTPSGRSIQAEGIEPDAVVVEEVPATVKNAIISEVSLHGHLKNEQAAKDGRAEQEGSSAYVNPDKSKDTQLSYALDLVRGVKSVQATAGRD